MWFTEKIFSIILKIFEAEYHSRLGLSRIYLNEWKLIQENSSALENLSYWCIENNIFDYFKDFRSRVS